MTNFERRKVTGCPANVDSITSPENWWAAAYGTPYADSRDDNFDDEYSYRKKRFEFNITNEDLGGDVDSWANGSVGDMSVGCYVRIGKLMWKKGTDEAGTVVPRIVFLVHETLGDIPHEMAERNV